MDLMVRLWFEAMCRSHLSSNVRFGWKADIRIVSANRLSFGAVEPWSSYDEALGMLGGGERADKPTPVPRPKRSVLSPVTFEQVSYAIVELTDLGGAFAIAAVESGRDAIHSAVQRFMGHPSQ